MACDLALMDAARVDHVGIVRVYEWSTPTVSFGRNERTAGIYVTQSLAEAGLAAVRRPTGGRALLHSREVTYSVAMPISDDSRWTAAYDLVNARLLQAMQALQVPANIVGDAHKPAGATRVPGVTVHAAAQVCFSGIAAGEIAAGGRKLIASAVWRERGVYLQHGSILLHDDQHRLQPFLEQSAAAPEPAAVLSDWLGSESGVGDHMNRVETALNDAFGDCGNVARWSIPIEVASVIEQRRSELQKPSWLWRR